MLRLGLGSGLASRNGPLPSLRLDFLSGALDSRITFTRGSTGTYFNASGVMSSAAIDTARFDYDPVTLAAKGLLIEEARTNLLTYSSDFSNVVWPKTNTTVTAAATTSPDGTVNAQKLAATTTAAAVLNSPATAVAATSATFSVYVKQGTGATTGNYFGIRNNTTATTLLLVTVNLATGTVVSYINGTTGVSLQNAGNGWWRVTATVTSGVTSGDALLGYVGFAGQSATAGDFLYAYGAQLEAGAFATSYIPTVASTVTRSADVATMTGTNFSSWYNQSAGTFVAQFSCASSASVLSVDDSTNSNFVRLGRLNTTGRLRVFSGGVSQADVTPANAAGWSGVVKEAGAYTANDFAAIVNGGVVSTATSGVAPTVTQLRLGTSGFPDPINGHIRSIAYYNTRLSNTQLQGLTA